MARVAKFPFKALSGTTRQRHHCALKHTTAFCCAEQSAGQFELWAQGQTKTQQQQKRQLLQEAEETTGTEETTGAARETDLHRAGQVVHVGTAGETASPEGGTAGEFNSRERGSRDVLSCLPAAQPFAEVGAVHYRKDYLEHHINTEHHQQSIKCHNSIVSGYSVMHAFEPVIIMEHKACLYWLVKNEIAHHTNYGKLLSLAQLLGCDYFLKLKIDRRNNYRSHRIIDEMLEIVSMVIEEPLIEQMRASQAISLELDERTDVSLLRQLDLHIRSLFSFFFEFSSNTLSCYTHAILGANRETLQAWH
ncbi:hypothetical protein N1851_032668 [Merluccius polli]|uniref:Uncharacterized protein n=1 Tax=Merluccius polli TaxID=89951 RepID=A0AA47NPA5_MERPO|nr:hypothetical protein N1851_032668 [Merluccius polli]